MATLIVCESPNPAEPLARVLERAGHRVVVVGSGRDLVDRLGAERPDAVLIECEGEPRGIDVARAVKTWADGAHVPVILLGDGSSKQRAEALGVADDVVARPFDVPEVLARLEAHLRTRRLVEEARAARAVAEAGAAHDPDTGLRSRVALNERLNDEWRRAARFNEPLALMVVAADGLELLQARRGAAAAARALRTLGATMVRGLRQIDVVARFGPNELVALLPNTHFAGALTCATRLRSDATAIHPDEGGEITVSMGISFYPGREVADSADLVRLAARALERAREEGPGNVCLIQHQGYLLRAIESRRST